MRCILIFMSITSVASASGVGDTQRLRRPGSLVVNDLVSAAKGLGLIPVKSLYCAPKNMPSKLLGAMERRRTPTCRHGIVETKFRLVKQITLCVVQAFSTPNRYFFSSLRDVDFFPVSMITFFYFVTLSLSATMTA